MDRTLRVLAPVTLIAPEQQTFQEMLTGWERQMRARGLDVVTVSSRLGLIRRLRLFLDDYPWNWSAADVEEFTASLLSGPRPLAKSTIRSYHLMIRGFSAFITDPRYDWPAVCEERFGTHPVQVCHDWNTHAHVAEFEARPARRPFSYDELEVFFAHVDAEIDRITEQGKKGALGALRDAQMFKTIYAFGLRRNEARMLDVTDLHPNPEAPAWGTYGMVHVRHGKSRRGGPARRRSVLAVPEFEWAIHGLRQWVEQARPLYGETDSSALWLTERRARVSVRHLDSRFAVLREGAGLDPALTLHSLRHSYVTHLIEFGYPERFVQEQVGHAYSSTTALYTSVSNDYKNRILARALANVYQEESTR
ncbi:tyrosine-type recombinase/integrase [Rathayibacter sp. AY1C5]|uniref:tyrosine-type recombinase/integrase n=1 Tax=Rathayibacter sp. AY1C5 TaxID=2080538 RepID=UPI0015E34DC5|nr:tyrosine-type recombinase/integrase [Rathayibacter sp. AY1C5]